MVFNLRLAADLRLYNPLSEVPAQGEAEPARQPELVGFIYFCSTFCFVLVLVLDMPCRIFPFFPSSFSAANWSNLAQILF